MATVAQRLLPRTRPGDGDDPSTVGRRTLVALTAEDHWQAGVYQLRTSAMAALDAVRDITAQGFRKLTWFPWHRPIRRRFNRAYLKLGASPLATAPIQNGLKLIVDLRSLTQRDVFYLGKYDQELLDRCARLLPDRCMVLDVGANIGLTVLPLAYAAKARGGKLQAFEPVPSNLERLRANIALNDLEDTVDVWPLGLSSNDGSATITLREDFTLGGTTGNAAIVIDASDQQFASCSIALRALDSFLDEHPADRLDFIKLDIEGHEDFFFEGAQRTLASYQPIVMFEVNKAYYERRGVDLDARLAALTSGYTMLRSESAQYRKWLRCSTIRACQRLDNVFLVPSARAEEALRELNR